MDKADDSSTEEELANKDTSQATLTLAEGRKRKRIDFSGRDGERRTPSYLVRLLMQAMSRPPRLNPFANGSRKICNISRMKA